MKGEREERMEMWYEEEKEGEREKVSKQKKVKIVEIKKSERNQKSDSK
jgi:hypothetical protein